MTQVCERAQKIVSVVESALEMSAPKIKKAENGVWKLSLHKKKGFNGVAKLEGKWLVIKCPVHLNTEKKAGNNLNELCQFLEWNSELPGLAKYGINGDGKSIYLEADVPVIEDESLLFDRILQAVESIRNGLNKCAKKSRSHKKKSVGRLSQIHSAEEVADMAALCAGAGWMCNVRPDQTIFVPLEVPSTFYQAKLEKIDKQGLRVFVDVVSIDSWNTESTQALGLILLKVSASLKMARPSLSRSNAAGGSVLFEVYFHESPTASELGHALCALSISMRFFAPVVIVMEDEQIARRYLALNGWS